MRIAMVAACPFPAPRGTPIRIHRMAEALTGRGHEVHVVTYHLGDCALALPFHVHRIADVAGYRDQRPGPTLGKLARLDPRLTRLLRAVLCDWRFDLIHAHHYEGLIAALLSRARGERPPIVYDSHTLLATELPHYSPWLPAGIKRMFGAALDRRLPRRADHVIAVTPAMRDLLRADGGIAPERISVIPNGVEGDHFARLRESGSEAASAAHAGARLVFAGNFAAYQGIEALLRVLARLRERRADARLILLSDSDFAPHEALAQQLGVRGAIELASPDYAQLPAALHAADVLVNPRQACEGVPQKLLNYMASGRPIVSFAGSAVLLEHRRNALVAADGDEAGFAAAVLELLENRALGTQLAMAAQELVNGSFSWQQTAARVEDVYRTVLARRGRVQPAVA